MWSQIKTVKEQASQDISKTYGQQKAVVQIIWNIYTPIRII